MTREGFVALHTLADADYGEIGQLQNSCEAHDGVRAKLNWDLITHREGDQVSDFAFYSDDQLVGYVPLDGFGGSYEITGVVHPEFRRWGIFRRLFDAAYAEAQRRGATRLLLVDYPHSKSGTEMAQTLGLTYEFSEYHMVAEFDEVPPAPESQLELVEVTENDLPELSRLLIIAFGEGGSNSIEGLREQFQRRDGQYWLARLDGEFIGQIGAGLENDGVYIRGVGIVPEYRSQGYGRQLITLLMHQLGDEGYRHFELDVEVRNANALSLYQSCGFHEANVYDYYAIPV